MKLIIGLGNPGKKYSGTRHNVGFEFLDEFKKELNFPEFELNSKFNSLISKGIYKLQTKNQELLLVKPQTFMNLSGEAVRSILDFYKLSPENILVIHDDKDILLGEYRLADDSSSAGHNGVQNIIDCLGTQKFKRIRIGVGLPADLSAETSVKADVFVLQKFTSEEKEKTDNILGKALEEVKKSL